jgi:hypothetical protein
MKVNINTFEQLQERVKIDVKHLIEQGEDYLNLWSKQVILHLYETFLKDQTSVHFACVRWIPEHLSLTRGRWAPHIPVLIKLYGNDVQSYLKSVCLYNMERSETRHVRFSLTEFIIQNLPQKIIIRVKIENDSLLPKVNFKGRCLNISLPPLCDIMDIVQSAKNSFNINIGELYERHDNFGFFDLAKLLNFTKEVLIESKDILNLKEQCEKYACQLIKALRGVFNTSVGESIQSSLEDFSFAIVKICLFGLPEIQFREITIYCFPHYIISLKERSLVCFFLYTSSPLNDEQDSTLREALAYVSSTIVGAEYARLVKKEILRRSSIVGITALSSRNLSHNLGSHILYWLEQEARKRSQEFEKESKYSLAEYFKSKALFYAYLRERMELVAGMALYLPSWTTTVTVNELVSILKSSLIPYLIGQSEGVYYTDVIIRNKEDIELAIPGSIMGMQAFYSIIENIARDAAKYGDIQSDILVIVKKIENKAQTSDEWREWRDSIICYHINKNPNGWAFYSNDISTKFKNSNQVKIILLQDSDKCCSIRRDIGKEQDLNNSNFIVWEIQMAKDCHHQLCMVIRELVEYLGNNTNDAKQICQKAKILDKALLSITVEVSDLDDNDFCENILIDEKIKQEIKDNIYRVIIYDDRSSYYSQKTNYIKSVIENLEVDGLIDESGALRLGEWGIKERYIFATYLRGEAPEDWLLPEDLRLEKTAVPPILRVSDCSGKLGWKLYILKPKDILLVSDTHKQDSVPTGERVNIWTWEMLRQRLTSSLLRHKFVILCPKDESQLAQIHNILDYLPYRVLVYYNSKIPENMKGLEEHCGILDGLDITELGVTTLYKKWINWIAKRRCKKIPKVVSIAGGKGYPDTWKGDLNGSEPIALFDRHGNYANRIGKGKNVIHYEPYEGGWAVERIIADFERGHSELEPILQEAALIRVLVIDERIDISIDQTKERFASKAEFTLRELWKQKGVDIMGRQYKGRSSEIPDEQPILDCVKCAKESGHPYDFVLLHQGIVDKLYEKSKEQGYTKDKLSYLEELINSIKHEGSVWHVILHSGRGGVTELPKGTKFIHLSSVEAWFGLNLSKADVVDGLMSLRRGRL